MDELRELALQELQEALETGKKFTRATEPPGWQAFLDGKADAVKEAFPDYLNNRHVLMSLIQARSITADEVKQMPEAMRRDVNVVTQFVVFDPWRHDLPDIIKPYRDDRAFMALAIDASPRLRAEYGEKRLDDVIRDAEGRSETPAKGVDKAPAKEPER